jgi:hypothetical protein
MPWKRKSLTIVSKIGLILSRPMRIGKPEITNPYGPDGQIPDSRDLLWSPYPYASTEYLAHTKIVLSAGCGLAELTETFLSAADKQEADRDYFASLVSLLMEWKASLPAIFQSNGPCLPSILSLQ